MTEKQKPFLESLISQYGYNLDSPLRKLFWDRVFQYGETVESASSAIEWLLKENHKRKFPKYLRFDTKEVQAVSDFAQFVFCPASHSIKKTFRYDSDSNQESIVDGEPIESTFLALLEQIRQNKQLMEHLHTENMKVLSPMLNIFLESTLIYNGYTNEYSKPFINEDYKISGKPKLIFSHPQKGSFFVVEKYVNPKNIHGVKFENLRTQMLSYLYLFSEQIFWKGIMVLWSYNERGASPINRNFSITEFEKQKGADDFLLNWLIKFLDFIENRSQPFDYQNINFNKCFHCSCRTHCNHKSGLIKNIALPYATPNFNKKYPLYYTWQDREIMDLIYEHEYSIAESQNQIEDDLLL